MPQTQTKGHFIMDRAIAFYKWMFATANERTMESLSNFVE